MLLLPTVTCFVPALRYGQPFRLSIHSWETPEPSQYLRSYSKHAAEVVFEARVFIDGKLYGLVGSNPNKSTYLTDVQLPFLWARGSMANHNRECDQWVLRVQIRPLTSTS